MEAHWPFMIMVVEWVLAAGKHPNKPTAREWPSSAFFEVFLPVESVYNQKRLARPGHRVTGSVGRLILEIGGNVDVDTNQLIKTINTELQNQADPSYRELVRTRYNMRVDNFWGGTNTNNSPNCGKAL